MYCPEGCHFQDEEVEETNSNTSVTVIPQALDERWELLQKFNTDGGEPLLFTTSGSISQESRTHSNSPNTVDVHGDKEITFYVCERACLRWSLLK